MNLFNYPAYIKQILPPKWRRVSWKLAMVMTLSKPLDTIYAMLLDFEEDILFQINMTPQVMVLESYLHRKTGLSNRVLFIADSSINGRFWIYLSTANSGWTGQIHSLLNDKIIAGSSYQIILF